MRILFITWNFPPKQGGMEVVAEHLYRGLSRKGECFTITCHLEEPPPDPRLFSCPVGGLFPFLFYALFRGFWIVWTRRIDLIVTSSAFTAPVAVVLATLLRRRSACAVHGSDVVFPHPLYQFFIRTFLPRCDLVTANSAFTGRLAASRGVAQERIRVVSPGVEPERFRHEGSGEALKAKYDLDGRFVILSAGRLTRRKGIVPFVEQALPPLVAEHPEIVLVVAGGDASDSLVHKEKVSERLLAAVARSGLARQVRYLGRVTEETLVELYNLCDLFILPALDLGGDIEGFGIVCLEAASAGKPVVATRSGGIPDAVADGETGLLLPPGDFEAIAQAIRRLVEDPKLRRSMGEAARKRAEDFRWERVIDRYWEAFSHIPPARRSPPLEGREKA
ncbi:MAG: glycosyltransferase family 1 protein [Deltaproteobacteria bacterium]|nr:MAG: glycosyltransferase family 1 protein [Deltaproteobacteria bacterium]